MEIYSPEIVTAQRELLYLLESDPGNASLIGASRQKLRLLGLTDEQINRLTETGEESYSLAIYSPYRGYLYEASALAPAKSASAQADPGQAASGAQVALSIREGMYVSRGQTVF